MQLSNQFFPYSPICKRTKLEREIQHALEMDRESMKNLQDTWDKINAM